MWPGADIATHAFSVNPVTLLVHLDNPPSVLAGSTSPTPYWAELAVD